MEWFSDSKIIKCEHCRNEWKLPYKVEVPLECPFCGLPRNNFYPESILHEIVNKYGKSIVSEEKRFKAIIEDYFFSNKSLGKRIVMLQRDGVLQRYMEIADTKDILRRKVLRKNICDYLEEDLGLGKKIVGELDSIFYKALVIKQDYFSHEDCNDIYYNLAQEYRYDYGDEYEDDEEWPVDPPDTYYRIMIVSACAGNEKAQKEICEKFWFNRVEWIDNEMVLEWLEDYYADEEGTTKARYAKAIGDCYAYGYGVDIDYSTALGWYLSCIDSFVLDTRVELLLRTYFGIGCEKKTVNKIEDQIEALFKIYEIEGEKELIDIFLRTEEELENEDDIDRKVKTLTRHYANKASLNGELEKSAFWLIQAGKPYLTSWDSFEERYQKELPKDKNIYEVMLQNYLSKKMFVEAIPFLEAAEDYGHSIDYGLIGLTYYDSDYESVDYEKAFYYMWKEYTGFKHNLSYFDWDEEEEDHHISERDIMRVLLDLLEKDETFIFDKDIDEVIELFENLECLDEFDRDFLIVMSKYLLSFIGGNKTEDDCKKIHEFFSEKENDTKYNNQPINLGKYGELNGRAFTEISSLIYGVSILENDVMRSLPYICEGKKWVFDGVRHIVQASILQRLLYVNDLESAKKEIESFVDTCSELDHSNILLYRLAKLFETDNNFGDEKISKNTQLANIVQEYADKYEKEKRVNIIGYDSTFTEYFVGLVGGAWDEYWVSFFDYESLDLSSEDKEMQFSNLSLPSHIIDKLESAGYHDLMSLNQVSLSDIKNIPQLGAVSAKKIQRALRGYYANLFWELKIKKRDRNDE